MSRTYTLVISTISDPYSRTIWNFASTKEILRKLPLDGFRFFLVRTLIPETGKPIYSPKIEITMPRSEYMDFLGSLREWRGQDHPRTPHKIHEIIRVDINLDPPATVSMSTRPMKPLRTALWKRFHESKDNPQNRKESLKQYRRFQKMDSCQIMLQEEMLFGEETEKLRKCVKLSLTRIQQAA